MKDTLQKILRNYPIWLGHLFFLIYLIYSVKLFGERGTITDNAVYVFNMANSGGFFTPHHRYGSVFVQIIPLLFVNLHCSLFVVMIAHSLSYSIFYYLIFIICVHYLKNISAGWILILTLCASVPDYFFAPNSEIQQGLAWVILYSAFLPRIRFSGNYFFALISFGFGVIAMLCHPLMMMIFLFVIVYEVLRDRTWRKISDLFPLVFCFIPFLLKPLIFPFDDYESGRMLSFDKAINGLQHFSTLRSTQIWKDAITHDNVKTLLLLLFSVVALLKVKKILVSIWVMAFFAAFLIFVNISNPEGEAPYYLATYLMTLALVAAYPVARESLQGSSSFSSWIIFAAIIFFFFKDLNAKDWYYGNRLASEKALMKDLKKYPQQKFIMNENRFVWNHLNFPWATAYETLIISALDGPDQCATVYVNFPKDDNFISDIKPGEIVFNPWERFKSQDLNQRYFAFKDSAYFMLNDEEINKLSDELP